MISPDIQYLVGGIPTTLKNISQLGLLFSTEWKKNTFMFQITNQILLFPLVNRIQQVSSVRRAFDLGPHILGFSRHVPTD